MGDTIKFLILFLLATLLPINLYSEVTPNMVSLELIGSPNGAFYSPQGLGNYLGHGYGLKVGYSLYAVHFSFLGEHRKLYRMGSSSTKKIKEDNWGVMVRAFFVNTLFIDCSLQWVEAKMIRSGVVLDKYSGERLVLGGGIQSSTFDSNSFVNAKLDLLIGNNLQSKSGKQISAFGISFMVGIGYLFSY